MGLLQLGFLQSFKEVTQRKHQQIFSMEAVRGSPKAAAGAVSGTCTHRELCWEQGGLSLRPCSIVSLRTGKSQADGREAAGSQIQEGGICNPITWAGPLAKTNRQSYLNIYSPSQASSGFCTTEGN